MVFRQQFLTGLLWRASALIATAFAFAALLGRSHYIASTIVSGLLCAMTTMALWRYVQRSNANLEQMFTSIRFSDLSQRLNYEALGSGFGEFVAEWERCLESFRQERNKLLDANRFYVSVLDDAPVALLTVMDDRVELSNKAARRLFGGADRTKVKDFADCGSAFVHILADDPNLAARLVPLKVDGVPQMAIISGGAVQRLGGMVHSISVQPIQSEFNAIEVAAQSDVVRVLTHEIMNSLTPVTSLAHSASKILESVETLEDMNEARAAIRALARRADGVMRFVEGYRQISRKPPVRRKQFEVAGWARELEALFKASEATRAVRFSLEIKPSNMVINTDPDLLSQVLLNLLRNGAESALAHHPKPEVLLNFCLTQGDAVQIDVADNGQGISPTVTNNIFLPFFTTKPMGTGVGLSVARQFITALDGAIMTENRPSGGALFRIIL